MQWIGRGWRGEMSLGKIFWLYGFAIPFVVGFAFGFLSGVLRGYAIAKGSDIQAVNSFLIPISYVFNGVLIVYGVWWCVGTWRSAGHAGKFWGILARIFVILCGLGTLLSAYGLMSGKTEFVASPDQQCREQMRSYALQNGADAEQYIAENQQYLKDCVDYINKQNARPAATQ